MRFRDAKWKIYMANLDQYKNMRTRQDLEPRASGASRLCQQSDLVRPHDDGCRGGGRAILRDDIALS